MLVFVIMSSVGAAVVCTPSPSKKEENFTRHIFKKICDVYTHCISFSVCTNIAQKSQDLKYLLLAD